MSGHSILGVFLGPEASCVAWWGSGSDPGSTMYLAREATGSRCMTLKSLRRVIPRS
jgi:hypothetical protein